jgi:predicted ATPase/DNA-binding XRE family transcriptional regulator
MRLSGSETSDFGAALRRLRVAAGLTQHALAERAGLSIEAVSALERGFRKTPHADTVALLAGALGVEASERAEFEAIATHRPATNGRKPRLPRPATRLIGREREVADILGLLRAHALVTLTGAGGVGKSRAALEVIARASDDVAGGAIFIDLVPVTTGDSPIARIASAVGVELPPEREPLSALVDALRERHALWLLDNCEHVVDALAPAVATILEQCPGITIVATSRQRLAISAEVTYALPPLALPPNGTTRLGAVETQAYDAVALFVERARQAQPDGLYTDETAPIVADICRRLDGIALAIELAAARVRTLRLSEIRRHLDERFMLLVGGMRDALPHHRTLRATFDWSYDLLDERERAFLCASAVFVNGFTLEAARAVGSAYVGEELGALDVLTSLVDKSLVQVDTSGDETRYRLLETTRSYGLERLAERRETAGATTRIVAYFRDLARERRHTASTGNDANFVRTLRTELDDIQAAVRWSLENGVAIDDAAEMFFEIGSYWSFCGKSDAAEAWAQAFLAALPASATRLRAGVLTTLALMHINTGRDVPACEIAGAALAAARECGDLPRLIESLRVRAFALARLGRAHEADETLSEAEREATPDLATPLPNDRGHLAYMAGDYATAASCYMRRIERSRAVGDPYGEMNAVAFFGEAEHARGETRSAIACVESSLERFEHVLPPENQVTLYSNLAGYRIAVDDVPGTLAAAGRAIALSAEITGAAVKTAVAALHFALGVALAGDLALGARLLAYSCAQQTQHGFTRWPTEERVHERLTALLQERLAREELARLNAQGSVLSPGEVLAIVEAYARGPDLRGAEA